MCPQPRWNLRPADIKRNCARSFSSEPISTSQWGPTWAQVHVVCYPQRTCKSYVVANAPRWGGQKALNKTVRRWKLLATTATRVRRPRANAHEARRNACQFHAAGRLRGYTWQPKRKPPKITRAVNSSAMASVATPNCLEVEKGCFAPQLEAEDACTWHSVRRS